MIEDKFICEKYCGRCCSYIFPCIVETIVSVDKAVKITGYTEEFLDIVFDRRGDFYVCSSQCKNNYGGTCRIIKPDLCRIFPVEFVMWNDVLYFSISEHCNNDALINEILKNKDFFSFEIADYLFKINMYVCKKINKSKIINIFDFCGRK